MPLLAALPLLAAGCSPTTAVMGVSAAVGTVAVDERGIDGVFDDKAIQLDINQRWLDSDSELLQRLATSVSEGRVLVTGAVPEPEMRVTAVRLIWQAPGVREVINEIEVADSGGIGGFARDNWISAQLRSRLTFDFTIRSINYSVDTVGGVVYLMGIAQDEAELQRVIAQARQIPYVRRVVSYARVKEPAGAGPAAALS